MLFPEPDALALQMPKGNRPWASYFVTYAIEVRVPAELIAAHCWRESRGGFMLTPKGPEGTGDNGHGRGLMQIDDRYHKEFIALVDPNGFPLWQKPEHNIAYGANLIANNLCDWPESLPAAVARYNASAARVSMALKRGDHPDSVTTGGDYVAEVLTNAQSWHAALAKEPGKCRCCLCHFTFGDSIC